MLIGQDREVLGDGVTEDGSEDAGVKAASVTNTEDRLIVQLVGDANARRKLLVQRNAPAHIRWNITDACNVQVAIVEIQQGLHCRDH